MSLDMLKVGNSCVIRTIRGEIAARLEDIGFVSGAIVSCVLVAPSGEPKAYSILGTTIALRSEHAQNVEVEPC